MSAGTEVSPLQHVISTASDTLQQQLDSKPVRTVLAYVPDIDGESEWN